MYSVSSLGGTKRAQMMAANLPLQSLGKNFSDLDDTPELAKVKMWVELVKAEKIIQAVGHPTCGLGLMLVGDPGHGKTTIASVALQELVQTIPAHAWGNPLNSPRRPVYFSDYPKLLRLQKAQWSEEDNSAQLLLDGLYAEAGRDNNVKVFVLDDLGKEYRTSSKWAENTFDSLLRARFNAGLPTIVTTNVSLEKWGNVYGEAMGSFAHEAFITIDVSSTSGDRRIK